MNSKGFELTRILRGHQGTENVSEMLSQAGLEPGILSLIGNGVTVVVLAYYVIYDVRVRTPAMLSAFTTEQEKLRHTFSTEQATVHEHYNAILDAMRQTFAQEQAASRSAFVAEQSAIRDRYEKQLASMQDMLFQNLQAMRTAVHDVRDTAQTLLRQGEVREAVRNQGDAG